MNNLNNKEMDRKSDLRAILYSDGTSVPNPGRTGGGIHGYIYDYNDNTGKTEFKPSRYVITNSGYKDLDSAINYIKLPMDMKAITFKNSNDVKANIPNRSRFDVESFSFIVNPICYIEGTVTIEHGTNNIGELKAAIEAIKHIVDCKVNDENLKDLNALTLYTDSSYVVNACHQTRKATYFGSSYTSNANKDLLEELNKAYMDVHKLNLVVEVRWVKGHATNIGNIKADMLADIARNRKVLVITELSYVCSTMIYNYHPKHYYNTISLDSSISDNIDKLISTSFTKCHLEIDDTKYLLFNGLKSKVNKNVGKSISPTSLVYVLKDSNKVSIKQDEVLDILNTLRNDFLEKNNISQDGYTLLLHLNELLYGDAYYYIDKYGIDSVLDMYKIDANYFNRVKLVGDEKHHNPIASFIMPKNVGNLGGLMFSDRSSKDNIVNHIMHSVLEEDIELYLSNLNEDAFDITNLFYKDGKSILTPKTEEVLYKNDKHFAILRIGVDTPELNVISKMSKKIEQVSIKKLENGFMVIFKSKDEYIVYHNPVNIFFIGDAEIDNNKKISKKKKK